MRILCILVALAGVGFGAWSYWEAQQERAVARAAVKLAEDLEAANRKGAEVGQVLKHFRQFCAERAAKPEALAVFFGADGKTTYKGLCSKEGRDS